MFAIITNNKNKESYEISDAIAGFGIRRTHSGFA